jgi:hypothetical protein
MPMTNATAPLLGRPADPRSAKRPADPERWARHLGRIAASYPLARPGITAGMSKPLLADQTELANSGASRRRSRDESRRADTIAFPIYDLVISLASSERARKMSDPL